MAASTFTRPSNVNATVKPTTAASAEAPTAAPTPSKSVGFVPKAAQPKVKAGEKAFVPMPKGTMPAYTLSYKTPKDAEGKDTMEKPAIVCGLFAEKTLKGEDAFSGVDKNTKVRYCLYFIADRPGFFNLVAKTKERNGKNKYSPLCEVEELTAKSGKKFLKGEDVDGVQFILFPFEKKPVA